MKQTKVEIKQRSALKQRPALKDRLERSFHTLAELDAFRVERNDDTIGRGIEAYLVGRELRELEHLALSESAR